MAKFVDRERVEYWERHLKYASARRSYWEREVANCRLKLLEAEQEDAKDAALLPSPRGGKPRTPGKKIASRLLQTSGPMPFDKLVEAIVASGMLLVDDPTKEAAKSVTACIKSGSFRKDQNDVVSLSTGQRKKTVK